MKRKVILCSCLAASLLLGGCAEAKVETPENTVSTETSTHENDDTVAKLRQELAALRQAQLCQSQAYEKRIEELEAMIAAYGTKEDVTEDTPVETLPFTYRIESGGAILLSYTGKSARVEIPATLDGVPVKAVGEGAFRGSGVEEVVLPEGVEEIGWFAFSGCYRLRSVTLPRSVKEIGYGAFDGCAAALCLQCPAGSFSEAYARSYGIAVGS